jgi:hypothetical protein
MVPVSNVVVGIDLADNKQMVVVTDHDSKVLVYKTFRSRTWAAAMSLICDRDGGDLVRTRRRGPARLEQAVRREITRRGRQKPSLQQQVPQRHRRDAVDDSRLCTLGAELVAGQQYEFPDDRSGTVLVQRLGVRASGQDHRRRFDHDQVDITWMALNGRG